MHVYKPHGVQAINPQALFWMFPDVEFSQKEEEEEFSTVTIRGPITQHGYWWDSYESIKSRFNEVCKSNQDTILVKIDSPGGEVAGCFDTARYIKNICKKAGKRIVVHVEGQCSSAAYALACIADKIYVSKTADVGSIGVLAVRYDETKADEISGFKVNLITSGARKSDWNPHTEFTKQEKEIHQQEINELAEEFFELVALNRGISKEEIKALEAGSFRGSFAVNIGLADKVGSLEHVIALLKSKGEKMDEKEKEAMDALRAIIDDEECSEEEKEKARKALAILEENEEKEEEAGDGEEEAGDGEEEAGDGEEEEEPGEEEEEEEEPGEEEEEEEEEMSKKAVKGVSASTAAAISAHSTKIEKRLALVEKRYSAEKKQKLIKAHGGVSKGLSKILMTKPLQEVKAILSELPKPKKTSLGSAAKTATVQSIRGGKDGSQSVSRLPPDQAKAMRRAMGLERGKTGIVSEGNVLKLGAEKPE